MIRIIPVAKGLLLRLQGLATAVAVTNGYLISDLAQTVLVECDFEGAISPEAAAELASANMGSLDGTGIFESPDFAKAIFGWDPAVEIAGLIGLFEQYHDSRGLDVGCGYGRLLIPLSQFGFLVDGVDASKPLIDDLERNLPRHSGCRVFRADIENFLAPRAYGFAYAAMNSVRYIEQIQGLHQHLLAMAQSLLPNGLYAFEVSVTLRPSEPYVRRWRFQWKGEICEIEWRQHSFCQLTNRVVDLIEVRRLSDGALIHRESQGQLWHSVPSLCELFEYHRDDWKLESCVDSRFNPVRLSIDLEGNYWFLARRKS